MNKKTIIIITFLSIILNFYAKPEITGSNISSYNYIKDIPTNQTTNIFSDNINIKFFQEITDYSYLNFSDIITPIYYKSNPDFVIPSVSDANKKYRAKDFIGELYSNEDMHYAFNNLDRIQLTLQSSFADFYFGRQAISWGNAHVINPTDIFAPYSILATDTDERIGIDAIRARVPFGMMNEFDLGIVFGEEFEEKKSAAYLRTKFYLLKTDVSLLNIAFKEHLLLGLDFTRAIGGAGFWSEFAYVKPYFFNENLDEQEYWQIATGFDYNLTGKLYTYLEYFYNSAGYSNKNKDISELESKCAYFDGNTYLSRKNYFSLGTGYQLMSLLNISDLIIYNLDDNSALLSLQAEYNIAENNYLNLNTFFGLGKENISNNVQEFGLYPDLINISYKIYF